MHRFRKNSDIGNPHRPGKHLLHMGQLVFPHYQSLFDLIMNLGIFEHHRGQFGKPAKHFHL